jgi:hypothetical protein
VRSAGRRARHRVPAHRSVTAVADQPLGVELPHGGLERAAAQGPRRDPRRAREIARAPRDPLTRWPPRGPTGPGGLDRSPDSA